MRKLCGALTVAAALLGTSDAFAAKHVETGVLAGGLTATIDFSSTFWNGLSGYVEFEGATLMGVDLKSETTQIFHSFVTGQKTYYPIEGGCSALLGGSCAIADPYPFITKGITSVQAARFDFNTPDAWFFRNSLYQAPQTDPGVYKLVTPGVISTFTLQFAPQDVPSDIKYRAVYSTASVPEPATWALLIAGLGGAGAALRRRRAVTGPARVC